MGLGETGLKGKVKGDVNYKYKMAFREDKGMLIKVVVMLK